MATARVEPIPQEPPPRKVILELSEDEWAALLTLSAKIVEGPLVHLFPDDVDEYYKVAIGNLGATHHPLPRLK